MYISMIRDMCKHRPDIYHVYRDCISQKNYSLDAASTSSVRQGRCVPGVPGK